MLRFKKNHIFIVCQTLLHEGYALVDIFQPCVTFNKTNTYQWFKENVYYLPETYDPSNRAKAFEIAIDTTKLACGIVYKHRKETYEERTHIYQKSKKPLFQRKHHLERLLKIMS